MAGWPTDAAIEHAARVLNEDDEQGRELAREVLKAAGLPELVGSSQAAEIYGVATGNLGKITGLPEPAYSPDEGGPSGGRLYIADEIREHAASRRQGTGQRAAEFAAEDKPILDRLAGKPTETPNE